MGNGNERPYFIMMMHFEITSYRGLKEAWAEISRDLMTARVAEDALFDSKLALCELVGNVLRYGGGRARVLFEREEGALKICVRGENGFRPPERTSCPAAESERGRGLYLVDAVCTARDYTENEGIRVFLRLEKDGHKD